MVKSIVVQLVLVAAQLWRRIVRHTWCRARGHAEYVGRRRLGRKSIGRGTIAVGVACERCGWATGASAVLPYGAGVRAWRNAGGRWLE